jgi:hypothetical protein
MKSQLHLLLLLPLTAFGAQRPIYVPDSQAIETRACVAGTDNWGNCVEADRKVTTIRASTSDKDDISADLLEGLKKANNGGLLHLEKGKRYTIGRKLDLSFLNDVYVKLDGELMFTNDIKYWQANYFYYPFQRSITWVVWGGKDIKIYGSGTMNGNGQAWYDGFSGKEITVRAYLISFENTRNNSCFYRTRRILIIVRSCSSQTMLQMSKLPESSSSTRQPGAHSWFEPRTLRSTVAALMHTLRTKTYPRILMDLTH